jgi:hypothetical protein
MITLEEIIKFSVFFTGVIEIKKDENNYSVSIAPRNPNTFYFYIRVIKDKTDNMIDWNWVDNEKSFNTFLNILKEYNLLDEFELEIERLILEKI